MIGNRLNNIKIDNDVILKAFDVTGLKCKRYDVGYLPRITRFN